MSILNQKKDHRWSFRLTKDQRNFINKSFQDLAGHVNVNNKTEFILTMMERGIKLQRVCLNEKHVS